MQESTVILNGSSSFGEGASSLEFFEERKEPIGPFEHMTTFFSSLKEKFDLCEFCGHKVLSSEMAAHVLFDCESA